MTIFDITLADGTVERVVDATAYDLDGPLTTFFTSESATETLDAWSVRIASFRSSDVAMIRRVAGTQQEQSPQFSVVVA